MRKNIISLSIGGIVFLGAIAVLSACASRNTSKIPQTTAALLPNIDYGSPVKIPDFTQGDWNLLAGLKFAK